MTDAIVDGDFSAEIDYAKIMRELTKQGELNEKKEINEERLIECMRSLFYAPDKWNRHGLNQQGAKKIINKIGHSTITFDNREYNKSDLIILYWGSNSNKCIDVYE